jgi:hypothetical protein
MMTFTDLASAPSSALSPFADRLRPAVAAYLARFKGSSREHTASALRCYLAWCGGQGLDRLAAEVVSRVASSSAARLHVAPGPRLSFCSTD